MAKVKGSSASPTMAAWELADPQYDMTTRSRARHSMEVSSVTSTPSKVPKQESHDQDDNDDRREVTPHCADEDGEPDKKMYGRKRNNELGTTRLTGQGRGKTVPSRAQLAKLRRSSTEQQNPKPRLGRPPKRREALDDITNKTAQNAKNLLKHVPTPPKEVDSGDCLTRNTKRTKITADPDNPDAQLPAELTDINGSTLQAVDDPVRAKVTSTDCQVDASNVTLEFEADVDSENDEDVQPSDKDMINFLTQSLADVSLENRHISAIAEIVLKGTVLPSPADLNVKPLDPFFWTSVLELRSQLDTDGHLIFSLDPSARALQLKTVIRSVLLKKIEDLKAQHMFTLNAFIVAVAGIIPQLDRIAVNVPASTSSEIKTAVLTAWEVLMWITETSIYVDCESQFKEWKEAGHDALALLDSLFKKVLLMRIELAPKELGEDLVPKRYARIETGWVELDLSRLDWVADVLEGNNREILGAFLDHTRCEMRAFVGHAAEQRERGAKHRRVRMGESQGFPELDMDDILDLSEAEIKTLPTPPDLGMGMWMERMEAEVHKRHDQAGVDESNDAKADPSAWLDYAVGCLS